MLSLIPALCILQSTDIKSTLTTYANAVISYDVSTLDRLLAKDYLEVSPLGEVDEREKVLSFYRVPQDQRGPAPTKMELSDWNIRFPEKSTAVVVFREDLEVAGRKMSFRVTSVLHQKGPQWQLVSNHVNGLRSKP